MLRLCTACQRPAGRGANVQHFLSTFVGSGGCTWTFMVWTVVWTDHLMLNIPTCVRHAIPYHCVCTPVHTDSHTCTWNSTVWLTEQGSCVATLLNCRALRLFSMACAFDRASFCAALLSPSRTSAAARRTPKMPRTRHSTSTVRGTTSSRGCSRSVRPITCRTGSKVTYVF